MLPQKILNDSLIMKKRLFASSLIYIFLLSSQVESFAKTSENSAQELPAGVPRIVDTNGVVEYVDTMYTTKAYQEECLRLITEEGSKVARELELPESIPIVKANLTHAFIAPFGYTYLRRSLGNITTSNYWYNHKCDFKFSDVSINKLDQRCREYMDKYQLPIKQFETNSPYQLATQWLTAVHMDVSGLNRDYDVRVAIDGYWNGVPMGDLPEKKFTPIYVVSWLTKGQPHYSAGGGASVELFLPTKTLLRLSVDDSKYILRPPIVFTNLSELFPGKGTITTNWPIDTTTPPRPGPN